MPATRLPFASMPWAQSPTHPLEKKKVIDGRGAILLRFEPGFADPNWCERSHVIHVLEGALELELDGETLHVAAGEACWVDRGTRHRARNPGPVPAVLFVVSDVAAG